MLKFLKVQLCFMILLTFIAAAAYAQEQSTLRQAPLTEQEMQTLIKIYPAVVKATEGKNYAAIEKLAKDNGLTTDRLLYINTKTMLLWAAVHKDDPEMKQSLNIGGQYAFTPEEEALVKKYTDEYAQALAQAFIRSKK